MWSRNTSRGMKLHFIKFSIKKVSVRKSETNVLVSKVSGRNHPVDSGYYSRKPCDDCRLFVIENLPEFYAMVSKCQTPLQPLLVFQLPLQSHKCPPHHNTLGSQIDSIMYYRLWGQTLCWKWDVFVITNVVWCEETQHSHEARRTLWFQILQSKTNHFTSLTWTWIKQLLMEVILHISYF